MEPFIGQLQCFGFNFAPFGWAKCDGQLLAIAQNQALFSLLGTIYGGNGQTTFALPDLRGTLPIHEGQGSGLSSRPIGQRTGQEDNVLTIQNMPNHTHPLFGRAETGTTAASNGNLLAAPGDRTNMYLGGNQDTTLSSQAIGNSGNATPVNNMPPVLATNWCIALTGVFPSF